jgi:hypothetical protein
MAKTTKPQTKTVVLDNVFEHNGKKYEITTPSLRLDKEAYTAAEAAANPEVCAKLIEIGAANVKPFFDENAEAEEAAEKAAAKAKADEEKAAAEAEKAAAKAKADEEKAAAKAKADEEKAAAKSAKSKPEGTEPAKEETK